MKRFDSYKTSGISWLNEIPITWTTQRIKRFSEYVINGVWGDEPNGEGDDLLCIRVADFDMKLLGISTNKLTYRQIPEKQRKHRILHFGDVIIEKSGGGELTPVGRAVTYNLSLPAVTSNFIGRIQMNKRSNGRYFTYLLQTLYELRLNEKAINQTTGIQNLDIETYFSELSPCPPYQDQKAIATYLDEKTTLIDETIKKKQQLIEFLQEERTVLINKAVTKGLDDAVHMKDSGVECLGEIPAHWEIKKLKLLANQITNGYVGPTRDILKTEGVRYIQSLHIKDERIYFRTPYYVSKEWSDKHSRSILRSGDLVIVQTGAVGNVAMVTSEFAGSNCHALIIVRLDEQQTDPGFYLYFLSSQVGQHILTSIQTGALHPHLNSTKVSEILVLHPPLNEQKEISRYILEFTNTVDKTIMKEISIITLLQEYRAALINEVVTGKRCVLQ